jgi:Acetyltransferase (GNAT) domain
VETEFIERYPGDGYRYDFDPYIFNLPTNLLLQTQDNWHSFYAVRRDRKLIRAQIHFHITDGVANSPYRNPFGSFEFSEAFTPKELFNFIQFIEDALRERDVRRVQIVSYPQLYCGRRASLLFTFMINHGFSASHAEVSACIEVSASVLFDSLSSWEKRKLRLQKNKELKFKRLSIERLRDAFDFIGSYRKESNQELSMTIGQLEGVVKTFPDRFRVFGIFDGGAFAAASIAIRINKSILYNFYSAYNKQYDTLSPIVGLIEGMYIFCQEEGIKLLDLGTSALRGKPNFSLLDFKMYLGATPTPKFTFTKVWS